MFGLWDRVRAGAAALLMLALVAACAGAEPAPGAQPGQVEPEGQLTVALEFAPKAGFAIDTDDAFVLSKLGVTETLVAPAADGTVAPRLATGWTQVDTRTWRFELREGVTFQDGTPLTPDAVVTALGYVTSVPAPPRSVQGLGLSATKDGNRAVLISTTDPDPILPQRLASPNTGILAPAAYRPGAPPAVEGTGTGPFTLTEINGVQSATVTRTEGYWGERPLLAGAQARFIPDPTARATAMLAGEVDLAEGIPLAAQPELAADPQITLESFEVPRTVSLYTNTVRGALADLRVRQALAAAVDRPALADQVLEGSATPALDAFGPAVAWGSTQRPPGADPEAARRLLAEAGYGPDRPLSLQLWTYTARQELPTLTTAIQQMLADAGVQTTIRVAEYNTLEPEVLAGAHDLFVLSRSYLTDIPDPAGFLRSDYTCTGAYNLNRYCSPAFDQIMATLGSVSDPVQRQSLFLDAAQKLIDDVAGVPLVHSQAVVALRGVTGFTPDPLEKILLTPQLGRAAG